MPSLEAFVGCVLNLSCLGGPVDLPISGVTGLPTIMFFAGILVGMAAAFGVMATIDHIVGERP